MLVCLVVCVSARAYMCARVFEIAHTAVKRISAFRKKNGNDFTAVLWMHFLTWGVAADRWRLCPKVHARDFIQTSLSCHFNVIWRDGFSAR